MPVVTNPLPFSAKFSSHSPPSPKQKSERDREYLRPDEVASLIRLLSINEEVLFTQVTS